MIRYKRNLVINSDYISFISSNFYYSYHFEFAYPLDDFLASLLKFPQYHESKIDDAVVNNETLVLEN